MPIAVLPDRIATELASSVSSLTWITLQQELSCLVTGHAGGNLGYTWIPATADTPTDYSSVTINYKQFCGFTHLVSTDQQYVAAADEHGSILIVKVDTPNNTGIQVLYSSISSTKQLTLGLSWSPSATYLAFMRSIVSSKSAPTLRIYSGVNANLSTTNVILPHSLAGTSFYREELSRASQRTAWSSDESKLFLSFTNNTLVTISTLGWQILSVTNLAFSPQVYSDAGALYCLTNTGRMLIHNYTLNTNLRVMTEDGYIEKSIVHCYWNKSSSMGLVVMRDGDGKTFFRVINKNGRAVCKRRSLVMAAGEEVRDIAWSSDSHTIVLCTGTHLYTVNMQFDIPSLQELSMRAVGERSAQEQCLPRRLREQMDLHACSLFYAISASSLLDLDVYNTRSRNALGRSMRVIQVTKDYLGQEMPICSYSSRRKPWKKSLKGSKMYTDLTEKILLRLLPEEILKSAGLKIKHVAHQTGDYCSIKMKSAEVSRVTVSNKDTLTYTTAIAGAADCMKIAVVRSAEELCLYVEDELIIRIRGESSYLHFTMHSNKHYEYATLYLIGLACIVKYF